MVARFEQIGGRPFKLEHIADQVLHAQYEAATDSLQKSFAALMLGYSSGDAMDVRPIQREFGMELTSIDEYARGVLEPSTCD